MKTSRLTKVAWVFLVMALITWLPAEEARAAAKYPSKPVTIVVGGGTGGSQDSGQRGIQPYLQKALGVSVIVNNLPGAGGSWAQTRFSILRPMATHFSADTRHICFSTG